MLTHLKAAIISSTAVSLPGSHVKEQSFSEDRREKVARSQRSFLRRVVRVQLGEDN